MLPVFDPRDPACKSPYGAVPCGTVVSFTLHPDSDIAACVLQIRDEFTESYREISLFPCTEGFCGKAAAPSEPTLLWYRFCMTRTDGTSVDYGKNGFGCPQDFQLTVYRPDVIPTWFGRGVTYQIFPDRFCRLTEPDSASIFGDRTVHEDWSEEPVYRPDEQGVIRNNDFFGGSLLGIVSKLDYLQSLSVTTLYLNPIFLSESNHRYDTADYREIDTMLGTEEELRLLCDEAHKRGMHVLLDGVFNHTGANSRYFNACGVFDSVGAAQSKASPYYHWYTFRRYPDEYDAWWGIRTLPAVNEDAPDYREYIIRGEDSVVRHYLRCGADGWRLDVADELPDDFIEELRTAMREEKPDTFLLGEVWEDASNKVAYGRRRRYLLGDELCGVMNYPLRTALIEFACGGPAEALRDCMEELRENYPREVYYSCLNILGTHDTPRLLTVLGAPFVPESREERADYHLSDSSYAVAAARLKMAAAVLYCLPGSPTIYYGDEAGVQGFEDPFCRRTYPWGGEDEDILRFYRRLGEIRGQRVSLQDGEIEYLSAEGALLVFLRRTQEQATVCAVNNGEQPLTLNLPWRACIAQDMLSGQRFFPCGNELYLTLLPRDVMILA